jgi:hypothetical protein
MPQIQAWWNVPCTWFVNPLQITEL